MDTEEGSGEPDFAAVLRAAVERRGISLRGLQQRLLDRGHEISVATLSLWQSGARRPSSDAAADVVRELEDLLGLEEDALAVSRTPRRRVAEDRNVPFASFLGLEHNDITDESAARQFSERSSIMVSSLDQEGRLVRNAVRNVWQARVDGAREIAAYITIEPGETAPPSLRAVLGCELVDIAIDEEQRVMRPVIRMNAPIRKGDLVLTEWESYDHLYAEGVVSELQSLVAVRPEVEVGVLVNFHPECLPRRCTVTVQTDFGERAFPVPLVGTCASHIEFDFGPGSITVDWEW